MSMRPEQIPYGVKDFKRIRLEGRYYVGFEGQTLMVEPTGSDLNAANLRLI